MQRFVKFVIAGVILCVFGILFGWLFFPKILRSQVHSQIALKEGSDIRSLWSKLPFPLEFRIYLFNVTNPDEIKNGQRPVVSQVGPYFFEEWQSKTDLIDRETDDTVEFSFKNKWIFKPERSEGLTGNEKLVLPHIFILAIILSTVKEKPSMITVINKAINSIFKNPSSVFMNMKAMDLMFNGLPIDCTVQDFAGSAVCSLLKDSDDLMKDGEDRYKFSLFGKKNDTSSKARMRVLRGVKNLMDVGVVVEYDGKTNISKWNDKHCDSFNGTDGTIFHPFLYENEDVVSFAPDLCRSLSTTFSEKTTVSGMKTNRYTAFLGDPNTIPSQKCYCEAPDKCLKKGVMDLYKCSGVPLIASHPHFYLADEAYLLEGLNPSKEEHEIFLDFEPFSGTPLNAQKRLQFNVMLQKVDKIKIMKNFPQALLPLFWVEEGVALPESLVAEIKKGQKLVTIVHCMVWIIIAIGIALVATGGFLYYRSSRQLQITKVKNTTNSGKSISAEQKMPVKDVNAFQSAPVPLNID